MIKGGFGAGHLTSQVSSNMDIFGFILVYMIDLLLYKPCESFSLPFFLSFHVVNGGFVFQQS